MIEGGMRELVGPVGSHQQAAEPAQPGPDPVRPPPERPGLATRRRHRRRIRWSLIVVLSAIVGAVGVGAGQRLSRPLGPPVMTAHHGTYRVPGSAPELPWPTIGQAAVAVPALGYASQSGPEQAVPVASLTKMATAVVILRDHPIPLGTDGPLVTVTPSDAAQFGVDLGEDETTIPLQAGEPLTELQLLEALLNQSAADAAFTLAVWDAGSEPAFVARMNALAASLGAVDTHYADDSGLLPQSVSTAADSLRIAAAGMAIPAFAAVADMPTVSLPLVGTVHNIVSEVGSDGVIGVKSGYTAQASGCMVLAADRTVEGRSVLVLAAALGQHVPAAPPAPPPPSAPTAPTAPTAPVAPSSRSTAATTATTPPPVPYNPLEAQYPLLYTGPLVEHLLDLSEVAVAPVVVAERGTVLATATAGWAPGARIPVVASRPAVLLGVAGQRVSLATAPSAGAGWASHRLGTAVFTLGSQSESVPLERRYTPPAPSWWRRLLEG